jgi:hypothetical protein
VKSDLIDSLVQTYNDFIDFVENPGKRGYMAVLCKLKPQAREVVKSNLMKKLLQTESDLIYVRNTMRRVMGYYDDDQPDGIKK